MDDTALLFTAALSIAAGIATLRISWGRKTRSSALNTLGWGLIVAALVLAWQGAGAWGASVVSLVGMATAAAALAVAAATAPAGKAKASNRRVRLLPENGEPARIGRRVATFLITVPLALLVSLGLAVAVRALADMLGASEADSIVLAFFAAPFAWAVLLHLLLVQERRSGQWKVLAIGALPVVPVILTGVLA